MEGQGGRLHHRLLGGLARRRYETKVAQDVHLAFYLCDGSSGALADRLHQQLVSQSQFDAEIVRSNLRHKYKDREGIPD